MINPPHNVFGLPVTPKPTASPVALKSFHFYLLDSNRVEGVLYRWDLQQFSFDDGQTIDGWFLTFTLSIEGVSHHVCQHDSTFFTNGAQAGLKVERQSSIKTPGKDRPEWKRRSDRWWPVKDGRPFHFIGQFDVLGYVGYLFSDLSLPPTIAALVDELGSQDVEDHYDEEAKRNC